MPSLRPNSHFRWFQVSLRTLLIYFTIATIACGWFGAKLRRAAVQRSAVNAIVAEGGTVSYVVDADHVLRTPAWLRNLLGKDFFDQVACVSTHGAAPLRYVRSLPELLELSTVAPIDGGGGYIPGINFDLASDVSDRESVADGTLTNENVACLAALQRIKRLQLIGGKLTDDGLAHLGELKTLESLSVNFAGSITDAGLRHLSGLRGLKNLELPGAPITGTGFEYLAELRSLVYLNLAKTRVTDVQLDKLRRLPQLRRLILDGTQVSDAGLAHLAGLKRLQHLQLNQTLISDAGLVHLRQLTELESLEVGGCSISDAGLPHLIGLQKLTTLRAGKVVSAMGFFELKRKMPQLYFVNHDED